MKEKIGWQSDYADRLPWMVQNANIEIIPFKSVWEKLDSLPPGSRIAVTTSPSKGIEATIQAIFELKERGFDVIPHIGARYVKNSEELQQISSILEENKIEEIFAIGGDVENPAGVYSDSAKMIDDLLNMNSVIKSIGVGGYPEGHPKIGHETLIRHLRMKIDSAGKHNVEIHVNSQACYDPKKILNWIRNLHELKINIPIYLGVFGPVDIIKLITMSPEIGVGDSVRFLKAVGLGSAIKSLTYDGSALLESLGGHPEAECIEGFHIFTLNNLHSTVKWQESFKA